ncbi:MAG: hypothetical protein ACTSVR_03230 [Candidatus Thorarchaeota archaeon]
MSKRIGGVLVAGKDGLMSMQAYVVSVVIQSFMKMSLALNVKMEIAIGAGMRGS